MAEPAAIKKFSIKAQLAEVSRELAMRERVYAGDGPYGAHIGSAP